MKVFGLYIREAHETWGHPILYSTSVVKLREVMRTSIGGRTVHVGSNDVTNSPYMNSYVEINGICLAKITEMPTLI